MANARMLAVLTITGLALSACDNESEKLNAFNELLVADFTYELLGDCNTPVLEVIFKNVSKNSDSYYWEFGDGTTSHESSPKKIYAKPGRYSVTLTATRNGEINQSQKEVLIMRNSDGTGLKVSLSYERTNSTSLEIEYTISANGLQYVLFFGDGQVLVSNETKITHIYSGHGLYAAKVTVENEEGTSCASVLLEP